MFYLFNLQIKYVNTTTAATIKTSVAVIIMMSTVGLISVPVLGVSLGCETKNVENEDKGKLSFILKSSFYYK